MTPTCHLHVAFRTVLLSALSLGCGSAATSSVGIGCEYETIQQAVNAVQGAGTIRITNKQEYTAQAIQIGVDTNVTLSGGYANCDDSAPSGYSLISGEGGDHDSVITVDSLGTSLTIENLLITGGDEIASDGYGGGIDFRPHNGGDDGNLAGRLTIRNSLIYDNYAGYGGGINVSSSHDWRDDGPRVTVTIEAGTRIFNNTAQYSGGGIRIFGNTLLIMKDDNIVVADNEARGRCLNDPVCDDGIQKYGYGGGVEIIAPAEAEIASPGFDNRGVIAGNRARYGGGIALVGNSVHTYWDGVLRLYSTDAQRPVRIENNLATATGGGIYVASDVESHTAETPTWSSVSMCASDFRIDHNQAKNGAALYIDTDHTSDGDGGWIGAWVGLHHTNADCSPSGENRQTCAGRDDCDSIDHNIAATESGEPTDGAIVLVQTESELSANRVQMRRNQGGELLRLIGGGDTPSKAMLSNCLLADNILGGAAVATQDYAVDLNLQACTIASNQIGDNAVIALDSTHPTAVYSVTRSIIAQPERAALRWSGPRQDVVSHLLTNDTGLADPVKGIVNAAPRFVDPERGDYHLQAASPAVDFAPGFRLDDLDSVYGSTTDIEPVPNRYGKTDLGAYERRSLQPMTLNGDFDLDLRFWWQDAISWNPQNGTGASGSGSALAMRSPAVAGDLWAASQCVYLPGPGSYRLNGRAYGANGSGVRRDLPRLHWQFRAQTSEENCTGSEVTRWGETRFPAASTWTGPSSADVLYVSENEWTPASSLTAYLIVHESDPNAVGETTATSAYFDDIELVFSSRGDRIFANGFER